MGKNPRKTKTEDAASIIGGTLYIGDIPRCRLDDEECLDLLDHPAVKAIRLISVSYDYQQRVWFEGGAKITESINFEMTLRKERKGELDHWYAYRRVWGKLHKRYVGVSEQITESKLLQIARKMPSAS